MKGLEVIKPSSKRGVGERVQTPGAEPASAFASSVIMGKFPHAFGFSCFICDVGSAILQGKLRRCCNVNM